MRRRGREGEGGRGKEIKGEAVEVRDKEGGRIGVE